VTVTLLASVAAAYVRALGASFQFDDLLTVAKNPRLADLGAFVRDQLPSGWTSGGRPVSELTFAIDHAIAGWSSHQFHLTNLLLHLATVAALLAFTVRVLRRVGVARPLPYAAAIGALWGLHPIQTEAVSYVCQRAEVLAALFTVVALVLLLDAEERWPTRRGVLAYLAALLAFAAGVGSKMTAAVVPALYLLGAVCLRDRAAGRSPSPRRVALLAAPMLAAVALGSVAVLGAFHGRPDVGFDVAGLTGPRYLLTQSRVIVRYLGLLFWPTGQTVDWDVRPSYGLDGATLASGLVLLALLGGAVWLLVRARSAGEESARAARLVAFGIGWFFLALAPTSTVVPLVDLMVEHRVYLASWGIVLAVVATVEWMVQRARATWARRAAVAAGALAALALAAATHARNAVWETNESLWRDAVAKSPAKPRPHLNLGQALWELGDSAGAFREYQRALSLDDGTMHPAQRAVAYQNASAALGGMGRHGEAIAAALKGLEVAPGDPLLMNNLAVSYRGLGNHAEARRWAEKAVARAPGLPQPHLTLSQVLIAEGDVPGTVREIRAALAADPESVDAVIAMAILAEEGLGGGRPCEWWARALRLAKLPAQRANAVSRYRALRCAAQ
jgi:tetratricopeptide (TPR) repeat protein